MSGGTATAIQPNPFTQALNSLPPAASAGLTSKPPTQANPFSQALQSLPSLPNPAQNMAQQAKAFCPSCLEAAELMSDKGLAETMATLQQIDQIVAEEQGFYDADTLPQEAIKKEAPVQSAAKEKPAELPKETKAETAKQGETVKQSEAQQKNNTTQANAQKAPNTPVQQQAQANINKPQQAAETNQAQQKNNAADSPKSEQAHTQSSPSSSQTALNTMKNLIAQNPYNKQALPQQTNLPRQATNLPQQQVLNQAHAGPAFALQQNAGTKALQAAPQASTIWAEGEAPAGVTGKTTTSIAPFSNKVLAFATGTLQSINVAFKNVGEKMAKVASVIQNKMEAVTAKITEFTQKVAQVLSQVSAKLASVASVVMAKVAAVFTAINQVIQTVGAKVAQWVSGMAQKASVFVADMAKTVRDYLGKLLSYFNSDEESKKKEKKNSFWEKIKQKLKRKVKKKKEEPKKETDEGELIEDLAA